MFKCILEKQPNSLLLVVGDGELRTEIEKKIEDLEIGDSVKLLGSRSDVAELMQKAAK